MRATGTSTGRRVAARFSIFAVARHRVLAAAGLSIFPIAAAFTVLRAHLAILAFAAVHGRLVALAVVFAACHRFAVFAFAAIRGAIFPVAARLAGVALMALMFAAGTRFRIGRSRGWRPTGLLRNGRQPRGQRQNQYNRNHSQFHFFFHLFCFLRFGRGNRVPRAERSERFAGGGKSQSRRTVNSEVSRAGGPEEDGSTSNHCCPVGATSSEGTSATLTSCGFACSPGSSPGRPFGNAEQQWGKGIA